MSGGSGTGDPEGDEARPPEDRDAAEGAGDAPAAEGAAPVEDGDGDPGDEPGPPARRPADETMRTGALPDGIRCPHCGEEESEQFAAFGSAVSVSQYWCRSCRTVFEAFKWR